jgi:hypothetical protein
MNRRSFFRRLVTATPIVAVGVPMAPVIDKGIVMDTVQCPQCLYVQRWPVRSEFPDAESWVTWVTTPQRVYCGNDRCRFPMWVTFARRI